MQVAFYGKKTRPFWLRAIPFEIRRGGDWRQKITGVHVAPVSPASIITINPWGLLHLCEQTNNDGLTRCNSSTPIFQNLDQKCVWGARQKDKLWRGGGVHEKT